MTRSFGIVEWKLFESDFFLEKMRACDEMVEAEFFLSAFLSATRAVTFALQASLRDLAGFDTWYASEIERLRENSVAMWFVRARNSSQKEGATFIRSASHGLDGSSLFFEESLFQKAKTIEEGALRLLAEVDAEATGPHVSLPDKQIDVVSKCERYLRDLVGLILRCYSQFGRDIDPAQYCTLSNMVRLGMSVEDFEEQLGFPRGWTATIEQEDRLAVLRREAGRTEVDEIFLKYLGVDRFGQASPSPIDAEEGR